VKPGEIIIDMEAGAVHANLGRAAVTLMIQHTGDRPVQVGSHFHFFEANPKLQFDRDAAYGMRLNIPAGTAVRFEPGEEKSVTLVAFGGKRIIRGGNGLVQGVLDDPAVRSGALEKMADQGFATIAPTEKE
jgi:urease subunit beta